MRCPPDLPRDVMARLRAISKLGGARARHARSWPHRLPAGRGRPHLPARGQRAAVAGAGGQHVRGRRARGAGLRRDLQRQWSERGRAPGADAPTPRASASGRPSRCASGSPSTSSASIPKAGDDAEAEYDAPETIDSIRDALESYGHEVVPFEATAELPRQLMETPVDLVFNIAEGVVGPQPRGGGARAVRADGHPLHRLRRGHAVHRARQGAVEARAPPARHPHRPSSR